MINTETEIYDHTGKRVKAKDADLSKGFNEHCRFKDAPCNYNGWGWYDRCAWCPDVNGFEEKNNVPIHH